MSLKTKLHLIFGYDIKPFSTKEWNYIEGMYYMLVWLSSGMYALIAIFTKLDKKTEKLQGKDIKKPESIEDHICKAKEEEKKHGGVINQYSYKRFL